MSILEKYRPKTIDAFIGLDKPKALLQNFVAAPRWRHFLFVGRPGIGKTAMAEAVAAELSFQIVRMPANKCTRDNVATLSQPQLQLGSQPSKGRVILVDQADQLTHRQQTDLRSTLDGYTGSKDCIWIFTATDNASLDHGFTSRLHQLKFSAHGNAPAVASFLEHIWASEAPTGSESPNFARIVKEAKGSIRDSLNALEHKLMSLRPR